MATIVPTMPTILTTLNQPCWWCNRPVVSGSYDRFSRFACYPCQAIQEAEAKATLRHVAATTEAARLRAVSAEVTERAAMWRLPA